MSSSHLWFVRDFPPWEEGVWFSSDSWLCMGLDSIPWSLSLAAELGELFGLCLHLESVVLKSKPKWTMRLANHMLLCSCLEQPWVPHPFPFSPPHSPHLLHLWLTCNCFQDPLPKACPDCLAFFLWGRCPFSMLPSPPPGWPPVTQVWLCSHLFADLGIDRLDCMFPEDRSGDLVVFSAWHRVVLM